MLRTVASRASQTGVSYARNEAFGKEGIGLPGRAKSDMESRKSRTARLHSLAMSAAVTLCFLLTGCAVSARVTPNSGIGQQLLFRSLERAVAELDSSRFSGDQIIVDVFTLSGDERTRIFAKEFLIAWLKERGFHVVRGGEDADLRFVFFLSVFGLDEDETLLGIPAFVAPMVGVMVPELAVYGSARNHGIAEVQLYAFDGQTGEFAGKTPVGVGRAKYDQYKALIIVNFTISDIQHEID